jgi:hypothetical protein
LKNKNQGIMKASEARKLKTNSTQCQTGKCAKLSIFVFQQISSKKGRIKGNARVKK